MTESKTIYKGIKYRIYPNKEQENFLQQQFGFARFVYNQCLDHTITVYKEEKKSLSAFDLSKWFRHEIIPQHPWIKGMDFCTISGHSMLLGSLFCSEFKNAPNPVLIPMWKDIKRDVIIIEAPEKTCAVCGDVIHSTERTVCYQFLSGLPEKAWTRERHPQAL